MYYSFTFKEFTSKDAGNLNFRLGLNVLNSILQERIMPKIIKASVTLLMISSSPPMSGLTRGHCELASFVIG